MHVPLDAYAGGTIQLRFHYRTDGGVAADGFFADDITVTADGATVFTDGAETGTNGWTADGFTRRRRGTDGERTTTTTSPANRTYVSYDKYLKTGPYNFGFANTKPDWVEHYAYQKGLLISYWDTSQADNNTSRAPRRGP